jgi:transcriptional regulator with XRE-family HTH domain
MNEQPKPFRVCIRLKNNRLVRAREDLGLSITALADACGVGVSKLCAFENFKRSPLAESGEWREDAIKLAHFHGVSAEWLWPEEGRRLLAQAMALEATCTELTTLPVLERERTEPLVQLGEWMQELSVAEKGVLDARMRGRERSEIAEQRGLSRGRIGQLEQRGLDKLRAAAAKTRRREGV